MRTTKTAVHIEGRELKFPAPPALSTAEATENRNESSSFTVLALPWMDSVYRYARSLAHDDDEAGDIVQDTYLRAFLGWHTFLAGNDCRRWLFAICYNVFLRRRHQAQRYVRPEDDAVLDQLSGSVPPTGWHQRTSERPNDHVDLGPAIAAALDCLPARYRSIVVLVDIEQQSYVEAAAVMKVPVGTVRSRLFRGRRMLRAMLLEYARDAGYGEHLEKAS